jgi:outer membrane protein OmpA-like peptidoglycan-associated protein
MKMLSRILIGGAFLGLAGCGSLPEASLGGTFMVEPFLGKSITGGDFNNSLAREYQSLADDAASNDVNWIDASAYARKGSAAMHGENVSPWEPSALGVSGEATSVYQNVVNVLAANKAARPAECAHLQAVYDHWVEELSEGDHSCTDPAVVKAELDAALAACGPAAPAAVTGAQKFIVYFGFDRYDLSAQARGVIDDVLAALKGYASPVLSIVGHTDTSGDKAYNQVLSDNRTDSVADAIEAAGTSRQTMSLAGRSEFDNAVQTGDGVREPLNRRVEITLSE